MTESVYFYQLVEFVDERKTNGKKVIDCVPTKWIEFDIVVRQCFVKFMPPPYGKKKSNLLYKMVAENAYPADEWPRYPITIRGRANTHEKAMSRLEKLKSNDYAYTTDADKPEEIEHQMTTYLKKKRQLDQSEIDEIFEMAPALKNDKSVNIQLDQNSNYTPFSKQSTSDEDVG